MLLLEFTDLHTTATQHFNHWTLLCCYLFSLSLCVSLSLSLSLTHARTHAHHKTVPISKLTKLVGDKTCSDASTFFHLGVPRVGILNSERLPKY